MEFRCYFSIIPCTKSSQGTSYWAHKHTWLINSLNSHSGSSGAQFLYGKDYFDFSTFFIFNLYWSCSSTKNTNRSAKTSTFDEEQSTQSMMYLEETEVQFNEGEQQDSETEVTEKTAMNISIQCEDSTGLGENLIEHFLFLSHNFFQQYFRIFFQNKNFGEISASFSTVKYSCSCLMEE